MSSFDPALLSLLVCPISKKPLIYDEKKQELISLEEKRAYPIRQGIPIMLIDQARILSQQEVETYVQNQT